MYKIEGKTLKGRCACGHIVRKNESYYITQTGKETFKSLCSLCADNPKITKTFKIPEDLVDEKIPIGRSS
jgi:hypothetical protein